LIGAVDPLRLSAPEIAITSLMLLGLQPCVDIQAFGEQMAASLSSQNFKFYGHGSLSYELGRMNCGR